MKSSAHVIPLGPAQRYLTTREAASRLNVSLRTVQLWVEASILPASRTPGGHRRIPSSSVEALAMNMGLPVVERRDAPAPQQEASKSFAAQAVADPKAPADVLLMTGDMQWQVQCVESLGYFTDSIDLRVASDGYAGLIHIGERPPELLIMSLDLPGMDGIRLLQTLAHLKLLDGIRVMVMVAHGAPVEDALPDDVELLPWPIHHDTLAVRVGRWLLSHRMKKGVAHE